MESAVVLESVSKRFGRTLAVRDLSLAVRRGELFAFVGPNGAGKTTTMKLSVGLLRPDAGQVHVCGRPMLLHDGLAAKRHLAYVPDQPFLYDKLTGREFLRFVARMYGLPQEQAERRLARLSERLRLEGFLDQLAEGYSQGMKQRVAIASALLHDPEVLVIDEPMVGLDPRTAREVKDLFIEHARAGGTVFLSTHTLDVAEALADRIGVIHKGRLVAVGTMAELRERAVHPAEGENAARLEAIFLRLTEDQHVVEADRP